MVALDAKGIQTSLADHLTNVTVIAFWATWCKPCLMELPQLAKLAAELHDSNVSVLAVDVGHDDRVDALALLASRHISVPVLFDNDAAIYAAVFDGGIMVIPATALVRPNGIEKDDGYEPQSDRAFVASWKRRIASHVK